MTKFTLATCALAALVTVTAPAPLAQVADAPLDLTPFFGAAGLTRDTNGDGLADTIAAPRHCRGRAHA